MKDAERRYGDASENGRGSVISVIVAAYGRPGLLREALESVVAQTYRPLEVIVVDDGSPESLEETVMRYSDRCPGMDVRYVRQRNAGPGAARNRGLSLSRGEYVVFLDSDDLLCPEMFRNGLAAFEERPGVDMVCGGWDMVGEGPLPAISGHFDPTVYERLDDGNQARAIIKRGLFPLHAVLSRRECLSASRGFNPDLPAFEDWEFWLRLVVGGKRIKFSHHHFARWRTHSGHRRSDLSRDCEAPVEELLDVIYSNRDVATRYSGLRATTELGLWLTQAAHYEGAGDSSARDVCTRRAGDLLSRDTVFDGEQVRHFYRVLFSAPWAQTLRRELARFLSVDDIFCIRWLMLRQRWKTSRRPVSDCALVSTAVTLFLRYPWRTLGAALKRGSSSQ